MNYIFIVNPHSGNKNKKEKIISTIKSGLKFPYKIVYTEYSGHAEIIAKKYAEKGVDVVAAVGGDGTINEVARSLVHSETALGIIPSGSGNGFARSLKIPLNAENAVQILNNARYKKIDSGRINKKYFFGICGVGFDALVGARFQKFGRRGPLPYFYIGLKEYFKYDYENFIIKEKESVNIYSPLLIAVANTSQYGSGAVIAPQADPADGYFDLCIIEKMKNTKALKNVRLLFNGAINQSPYYYHKRVKSVIIQRVKSSGYYHVDGEPYLSGGDLNISVIPASLKICAP